MTWQLFAILGRGTYEHAQGTSRTTLEEQMMYAWIFARLCTYPLACVGWAILVSACLP